jgi:hypothetical protein
MQSRLSNSEMLQEITDAVNRSFQGPAPIQFTEEQILDTFGGMSVIEHLEKVVDSFDAYVDAEDAVALHVQMGADDEDKCPPSLLELADIQGVPYTLLTKDGSNWLVVVYKNAVTLTALHGETEASLMERDGTIDPGDAFTITIWAA